MKTSAQLLIPDEAEATVSFTLKVKELKKLADQFNDPEARGKWPLETLKRQIAEVLIKADAVFMSTDVKTPA